MKYILYFLMVSILSTTVLLAQNKTSKGWVTKTFNRDTAVIVKLSDQDIQTGVLVTVTHEAPPADLVVATITYGQKDSDYDTTETKVATAPVVVGQDIPMVDLPIKIDEVKSVQIQLVRQVYTQTVRFKNGK